MEAPLDITALSLRQECKTLTVLGATGSIGTSTLDLVARNRDQFAVQALTANRNVEELAALAKKFDAQMAVIADETLFAQLRDALAGTKIRVGAGEQGLQEATELPADITMAGIMGAAGLRPTLSAVGQGKRIALANKECLVAAGALFMRAVKTFNAELIPVDSEHSAIFQALDDSQGKTIDKIILTASGGPFRTFTQEQLKHVTPKQALKHPNWSMGRKISIDSATMMNKGLELIEALHLFPVETEQLDIVIHPQSIIHSLVSYVDGSVIAQLGAPDMRTPIAYSLAWPERMKTPVEKLDLAKLASLTFESPDEQRFPALKLARQAMETGGNTPTIMNAANEIAVEKFLSGKLPFMEIPFFCERIIEQVQRQYGEKSPSSVEEVLDIDHNTRIMAHSQSIV